MILHLCYLRSKWQSLAYIAEEKVVFFFLVVGNLIPWLRATDFTPFYGFSSVFVSLQHWGNEFCYLGPAPANSGALEDMHCNLLYRIRLLGRKSFIEGMVPQSWVDLTRIDIIDFCARITWIEWHWKEHVYDRRPSIVGCLVVCISFEKVRLYSLYKIYIYIYMDFVIVYQ